MKVSIEHIQDSTKSFREERPYHDFPVLTEMVAAGECSIIGPVSLAVTIGREHDHYRADGTVCMPIQQVCSRCLTEFATTVRSDVTVIFTKDTGSSDTRDEQELDERDLITVSFSGDEIDLAPEIAEQLALSVPVKPLCSEECLGLCPNCGAVRTAGPCGCNQHSRESKFAVLKDFKVRS